MSKLMARSIGRKSIGVREKGLYGIRRNPSSLQKGSELWQLRRSFLDQVNATLWDDEARMG